MKTNLNLKKGISIVELLIWVVVLGLISVVAIIAYNKMKANIWWATKMAMVGWTSLTQVQNSAIQWFTTNGQSPLVVVSQVGIKNNLNNNYILNWGSYSGNDIKNSISNWVPFLVVSVNKQPMQTDSWHPSSFDAVEVLTNPKYADTTGSLQQIATYNSQNNNALTIQRVDLFSDSQLKPNETMGWVLKPVWKGEINDVKDNVKANYFYDYILWQ